MGTACNSWRLGMEQDMTKDEALKMALEAFDSMIGRKPERVEQAITAIKEALANEALEKMAENARELGLDYEPEQPKVRTGDCLRVGVCASEGHKIAPQRTWVGLTRIELIKCGVLPFGMSYELYEAIEQALKERNT